MIPLGSGTAEQLRQGKAFWEILDDHGVPNSVFRIPANFPPVPAKGNTLSGMGTPDLRGTYGTFTFYTDDPMATAGAVEGGEIVPVQVENSQVTAQLIGPDNSFRKGSPPATEPFTVHLIRWNRSHGLHFAGSGVRPEGRRVERLDSGRISTDSISSGT